MAKDRLSGKLAVILHADIAGSTALVQQDEQLAHERIQNTFRRFSGTIERYQGRVRELRGDALLAEFDRASDAVTAVLAFQAEQAEYIAQLNDNIQPLVRVGIALGEVIIADNTVTGAGVVLAQRIEQLAEPGGLCITAAIHEALPQRMPFDQENLGEHQVKGFDEQIRVYAMSLAPGATIPEPETPPRAEALRLPDKPSIAVLPFTNMSGDPEQEYFADGIVEDIITELSREPDIFVIARNSSFAYKGQSPDIRQVGRELGVRYVLEGSVRKAGNRIRLNAQLIEAETNHHIWAERYDCALEGVFELQDELTSTITNTLLQKVRDTGIERALRQATRDLDAYDYVLRAFGTFLRLDQAHAIEAIRLVEAALAIDPDYARAHTLVAWVHLYSVMSAWVDDTEKALELGYQAAIKGVAADGEDYWGYTALGFAELFMHRPDRALAAVDRAVALNPNNADAHTVRGAVLNFLGRPEEGLAELELAMRHNPHYPDWYLTPIGRAYYLLGRYDEGIPYLERLVNVSPEFISPRAILAASYMAAERTEDARAQVAALLQLKPSLTSIQFRSMAPFSKEEDLDCYLGLLRQAGLPD
jgi:adenylate cyclase